MAKIDVFPTGSGFRFEHPAGEARSTNLPGTDEIMHMHGASVKAEFRSHGFGTDYHKDRIDWLIKEGCVEHLTCIVNLSNEAQVKIVNRVGWKCVHTFKCSGGRLLGLFVLNLNEKRV